MPRKLTGKTSKYVYEHLQITGMQESDLKRKECSGSEGQPPTDRRSEGTERGRREQLSHAASSHS